MAKLRITWKRSAIGRPEVQKRTVRALGLRKLNQTVEHEDTPRSAAWSPRSAIWWNVSQ